MYSILGVLVRVLRGAISVHSFLLAVFVGDLRPFSSCTIFGCASAGAGGHPVRRFFLAVLAVLLGGTSFVHAVCCSSLRIGGIERRSILTPTYLCSSRRWGGIVRTFFLAALMGVLAGTAFDCPQI